MPQFMSQDLDMVCQRQILSLTYVSDRKKLKVALPPCDAMIWLFCILSEIEMKMVPLIPLHFPLTAHR